MTAPALGHFIAQAAAQSRASLSPADSVQALAPLMLDLIGAAGIVEGVIDERSYVRLSPDRGADSGIELVRGGVILLGRGAVTSFVPNPDHIHITGVPPQRPRAVSLHLYGRTMNSFHMYDMAAGTRKRVDVAHNKS